MHCSINFIIALIEVKAQFWFRKKRNSHFLAVYIGVLYDTRSWHVYDMQGFL